MKQKPGTKPTVDPQQRMVPVSFSLPKWMKEELDKMGPDKNSLARQAFKTALHELKQRD